MPGWRWRLPGHARFRIRRCVLASGRSASWRALPRSSSIAGRVGRAMSGQGRCVERCQACVRRWAVRPPGKAPLGGGRACSVPQLGPARAGGIDPTHRFSRPAASRRAGRPPSPGRGRFRVPRHGWLSPGVRRNACLAVRMSQPRQVDVSGSAQRSFATRSAGQSQGNLAGYPFESVTYRDMLSRILHQKAACPRPRPPCPLRAAALTRHGARAQPSTDRCAASMCALQSL